MSLYFLGSIRDYRRRISECWYYCLDEICKDVKVKDLVSTQTDK